MKMRHLAKNRKNGMLLLVAFILAFGSFHAGRVYGAGSEPGSSGDPLITKSYLDAELSGIETGGFRKIKVPKGRTLSAGSGTQLILYSGTAAVSSEGSLLNISTGDLFAAGDSIAKYQSYLVPEKGRGITCSSECILFIQGKYE